MAKFLITERLGQIEVNTVRLGLGTGAANFLTDKEAGKFVKLVGDSRYALCAVGDSIEGRITTINEPSVTIPPIV